jgi:diguanylate cyclase (GGDEF)-like protein
MNALVKQNNALILVVDDDQYARILMREVLEKTGFTVIEAEDGKQALALFEDCNPKPDAVLLDVMMPEMDGYDVCRSIREHADGEFVPILMMTGLDDVDSIHRAFEVGATDFVAKPINWVMLSYRVRYMLRASNAFQALKKAEEQIRHLAFYDGLTGLAKRELFIDRLEKSLCIAKRRKSTLAVLFLDLDRFKRINDTLGHHIGDLLLKEVAERIRNSVRCEDSLGRFIIEENRVCTSRIGGDEFVLLLTHLPRPDVAAKVAERIVESFSESFNLEGHEVHVTTSVGISLYPHDGEEAETLMKNADTAMYEAKRKGRNNLQFFREELNSISSERLTLENDLRSALEKEEFLLHYQPQIDLRTGQITGAEALIRWQHPGRGLLYPATFIEIAEDSGLIRPMTEWVIRAACRQNKAWQDDGLLPIAVAVNLSGHQFCLQDLETIVSSSLEESGLAACHLEVELTESVLMENKEGAVEVLQALKNLGVSIAIDDFGTGYSSLAYLRNFPIDTLKIDKSFVQDVSADSDDASITQAIIALAHSLQLGVIAEGVETEEQLDFLKKFNCRTGQGFLFSRPVSAADFTLQLQQAAELQNSLPVF